MIKAQICGLKPHPRQAAHFTDLSDARLRDLADQLRIRGLERPIEIMRDGTIICGHQRVRAAILLGWEEIDAVVRDDLEALGPGAVEERLIRDNLDGRQLDPLEVARCYQGLKKLMTGPRPGRLSGHDKQDLRDVIGEQLGLSGRTLDRHLRVLETPVEVQRAVSARRLSKADAGKVAALPAATQQEIAIQIREGVKPKAAVAAAVRSVPKAARPGRHWHTALALFVRGLSRAADLLDEHMEQIRFVGRRDCLVLRHVQTVIERLLALAEDGTDGRTSTPSPAGDAAQSDALLPERQGEAPTPPPPDMLSGRDADASEDKA